MRAARVLLRAHGAMAPLWRLLAVALAAQDGKGQEIKAGVDAYMVSLEEGTRVVADLRWIIGRRARTVLTHSSSATVVTGLTASKDRIEQVLCTASLPGGEGRSMARRLSAAGIEAHVIADAEVARACDSADLVVVGADAITEKAVVNKVGTKGVALAAREAGVACYALAPIGKFLPHALVDDRLDRFESTALELFDAIVTERGPKRPAAVRRLVSGVDIPSTLRALRR